MYSLRGVETFVWAVALGSIAAAARRLEISPAAASQNITRLEKSLQTRLLSRTTRNLALTDSGDIYYQHVRGLIQQLDIAKEALAASTGEVQGKLSIACSAAFARHVLAPLLPGFNHLYPKLRIEMISTDRRVDHVREGMDVSIRIRQQLEDGIVAKKIATVPTIFCAAPSYLQTAGYPVGPEALKDYDCLVFRVPTDSYILPWGFLRDGRPFEAERQTTMISDDIDVLAKMAVAGGGITRLASFVADPYIANGQLEELFYQNHMPHIEAEPEPLEYYLCVADRYAMSPKVQKLLAYLREYLPAT